MVVIPQNRPGKPIWSSRDPKIPEFWMTGVRRPKHIPWIREKAKVRPEDILALRSLERDGAVCCFSLIKVEELEKTAEFSLGPVINEAFQQSGGRKMKDQELKMAVKEGYSRVARSGSSCCQSGCCGSAKPQQISRKIGYTEEQMEAVPEGSNLGLGCGNPVALAALREGETVLDLGSGAGFDCFLASRAVGEKGKVIGVDMTEEMLERAAANARKGGYSNVEFRRGEIEALPVEDGSVDAVISNCVINLVPNKDKAFREAFRVLRPGGRLMVSDIVIRRSLPDFVKESIQAYVGCLAGAVSKERYLDAIARAGFEEIDVIGESDFPLDCMSNDPTGQAILISLRGSPEEIKKVEGSISSLKVSARKPGP